ncbi:hypothetical protein GIB67_030289 [Kingdonia uniflora]|uniref:Myb/SANT-like domain-containing protein n=1 Tax=Kingdonia uniflora TaxID=39325 RepID=A0A7J7M6U6_9MAGN|nr:hypothetical protein GIB67_030289 [Kingdonia uniflora]
MSKGVSIGKGTQKKNGGSKKEILKWNAAMDVGLIEALVEGRRLGLKENNIWDDKVWTMVQNVVQEKAFIQVERSHIDNIYRSLRKEYIAFDLVKSKSGFGWDQSKKTVTTSDEAWKILLEDPCSRFRYEGPKWSFESLQVIFGQNHATGKYSFNGMDSIDGDNDIGGDDTLEVDSASMATSSASKRPRVHKKKAKNDDEVKHVLYSLHSSLDDMKNNIDPVKRASNILDHDA